MADGGDDEYEREIVWVCTQCGRHHQKHSPPCSRCGNVDLEKDRPDYSDLEAPGGTSYLDVLEPKYAIGYIAVIAFAVLVALSLTGIVSVPWLGGPTPPGAPGDAETYDGVSLEAVEDAYVAQLNERRAEAGADSIAVDSTLDDAATAVNQRRVRAAVEGTESPAVDRIVNRYEPDCGREVLYSPRTALAALVFDGSETTASEIARGLQLVEGTGRETILRSRYSSIGVDVHVSPDGTVFVTVLAC